MEYQSSMRHSKYIFALIKQGSHLPVQIAPNIPTYSNGCNWVKMKTYPFMNYELAFIESERETHKNQKKKHLNDLFLYKANQYICKLDILVRRQLKPSLCFRLFHYQSPSRSDTESIIPGNYHSCWTHTVIRRIHWQRRKCVKYF